MHRFFAQLSAANGAATTARFGRRSAANRARQSQLGFRVSW